MRHFKIFVARFADYSAMRNMLYGEIPSFETMMEAVGELEKEINAL